MSYTPPSGDAANADFQGYVPPSGDAANAEFGVGDPTLQPVIVEVVLPGFVVASQATLQPVVVEAVIPALVAPSVETLSPVVVEVVLPGFVVSAPTVETLSPVIVEAVLPGFATAAQEATITPIVVEAVLPGLTSIVRREETHGQTGIIPYRPDGTIPEGLAGPIMAMIEWETRRGLNRVGTWRASMPVDAQIIDGQAIGEVIEHGWRVSLIQEENHPLFDGDLEFLLYMGKVDDKTYSIGEHGKPVVELTGSMRAIELVETSTPTSAQYSTTIGAAATGIVQDRVPLTLPPSASDSLSIEFNTERGDGVLSLYTRLLRVGEASRYALRERWGDDSLEFVEWDAPPDSGYVLLNQEVATSEQRRAGLNGFALIGGTPTIQRRGPVINRIIPFGTDTVEDGTIPLTLLHASQSSPYAVEIGVNPDSSAYFYVEDTESIDRFGLVEAPIQRSDVKNPSDDSGTRTQAGNVLYNVAVGELQRHKSPKLFLQSPIANGPHVWALPGDRIKVEYVGNVERDDGTVTWAELDRYMLVTDRVDRSTRGGVRDVTLTLGAPEIEIPIDGVNPIFPIVDSGPGGGSGSGGGIGGGGIGSSPLCCPDRGGGVTGGGRGSGTTSLCDDPVTSILASGLDDAYLIASDSTAGGSRNDPDTVTAEENEILSTAWVDDEGFEHHVPYMSFESVEIQEGATIDIARLSVVAVENYEGSPFVLEARAMPWATPLGAGDYPPDYDAEVIAEVEVTDEVLAGERVTLRSQTVEQREAMREAIQVGGVTRVFLVRREIAASTSFPTYAFEFYGGAIAENEDVQLQLHTPLLTVEWCADEVDPAAQFDIELFGRDVDQEEDGTQPEDLWPELVVDYVGGSVTLNSTTNDGRFAMFAGSFADVRNGVDIDEGLSFVDDTAPNNPISLGGPSPWFHYISVFPFDTSSIPDAAEITRVSLRFATQDFSEFSGEPFTLQARLWEKAIPLSIEDYPPDYEAPLLATLRVVDDPRVSPPVRNLIFESTSAFAEHINTEGTTALYIVRAGIAHGGNVEE